MAVAAATGCGASEFSLFHLPAARRLSNPLLVQTPLGVGLEGSDANESVCRATHAQCVAAHAAGAFAYLVCCVGVNMKKQSLHAVS